MGIGRRILPYLVAIASPVMALLLSLWLEAIITRTVGTFFYVAVALSAGYGGLRPGLVAIALSTLAINYFLIPPLHQLYPSTVSGIVQLGLFITVALIINGLTAHLKESRRRIERLSQELLQESSDRLKVALNAAQMGLWDWNRVTGEIQWFAEHEHLFGLAPGQFDGRYETFLRCLHPDDREETHQAIIQALADHTAYHQEFRVIWADGSIHWVEGRGQFFYDATGMAVRMSGTVLAIDARKHSEQWLHQQVEQQRLILEITKQVRRSLDVQDILQTTVDEVRHCLQTDRVIIFRFFPDWRGVVAVESCDARWTAILSTEIDDPCFGEAYVEPFRQGLVTAKSDIYTAGIEPCYLELLAQFQVRANLVVPILQTDGLWGLLIAHHCAAPRQWQDSEIDLLRQMASQISIALQQADLFAQVNAELVERKQQESLLRLFIQYTPTGIAMLDREMRYLSASQRWVDEYGLESVASLIQRSHYEIFPDLPERWHQVHQRCVAGATERCDDDLWVRADGAQQWISWEVRPWYTATNDIGGIIIFSADVTHRKQAEDALKQNEARLRLAQLVSNSAVWDMDVATNTVTWSPEYYQLYGLEPTVQPSYDNWLHCVHPEDRDQVNQQALTALQDRVSEMRIEFRVVRRGEIRWFASIGQIFRDADHQPIRTLGIAIDITPQKRAEIALQELNAELEQRVVERTQALTKSSRQLTLALHELENYAREIEDLYNNAPCGYHSLDAAGMFVRINDTELTWLGYSRAELVSKQKFVDLLPPASQQIFQQNFPRFKHQGWINNVELEMFRKDGTTLWLSVNASAIRDEAGNFVMSRSTLFDITHRKLAEAALQQQSRLERLRWSITQGIRQSLDLPTILNTAVDQVRRTLRGDRVVVYQFRPDWGGNFVAESVSGGWVTLVDASVAKVWDDTYLQETAGGRFQQHEAFVIPNIYTAGLQPCHIELLEQFQTHAYAVVPIVLDETLWGLLAIYQNTAPRHWEFWEVELLQQIASQLAIAIRQSALHKQIRNLNASLEVQVQERTRQLQQALDFEALLKRITDRVRDSLDENQILQTAVEALAQGLPVFACDTGIYNAAQTTSTITHESVTTLSPAQGRTFTIATAIHAEVYPCLFGGLVCQFCDIAPNPLRSDQRLLSTLAVPIVDDQGVLGDMWLFKHPSETFDDPEVRLVQQVANQCAIALRQSRLYQAAQQQVEELERLNLLKDDFLSTVSHELRTPMASIKMATQMLEIRLNQLGVLDDESNSIRRYLHVLQEEGERELCLINDLLDLTRLDAEVELLTLTPIDLKSYLPHLAEPFIEQTHHHQQPLIIQIPDNLPPISIYLPYLERILTELLHNACKYTPPGGIITLSAQTTPESLEISVSNTGVTIPETERERIFEKFYRIPHHDPWKYGGTGLGLALVKTMTRRLQGTITVSSQTQPSLTQFTLHLSQPCPDEGSHHSPQVN